MAAPRPRLVRRAPLSSRIKAYLNPWDFLLWASEELNGNDWEDFHRQWTGPLGIILNVVFMVARANSSRQAGGRDDDVFGDYHRRQSSGWLSWLASFIVHFLTLVSFLNAFYTFQRKKHYRLFEANVDVTPSTPSARRVKVDSSPLSSSPLRFLSNILAASSAEARAHPDAVRDVWELAVWDPTPVCLRLFCLFSPGHVLVYWLFFPLAPLDPRPSITVITTIILAALLSAQLLLLQLFFSRQSKDGALIRKEVQNEYDTKFVHPSLNKEVRDVATQIKTSDMPVWVREVDTFQPVTFVNRGFRTNPNPNYVAYYDPTGATQPLPYQQHVSRTISTPKFQNPTMNGMTDFSSPIRSQPATAKHQPYIRQSELGAGASGNFGIYNHAYSPLRKTPGRGYNSGFDGIRERSPAKRGSSPLKSENMSARSSAPTEHFTHFRNDRSN